MPSEEWRAKNHRSMVASVCRYRPDAPPGLDFTQALLSEALENLKQGLAICNSGDCGQWWPVRELKPIEQRIGQVWVCPNCFDRAALPHPEVIEQVKEKPVAGYIYFMYCQATGLTKIGRSTNVEFRRREIERSIGESLEVLHVIKSQKYVAAERRLHKRYSAKHHHDEWFALTEDDLAALK